MAISTRQYIAQRLLQWFIVIFVGVTVTFAIPRLTPMDPVQSTLNSILAYSQFMEPEAVQKMTQTLKDLYGLSGTVIQQYFRFWGHLLTELYRDNWTIG